MMEINGETVEAMADAAGQITGGAFALGFRANGGDGDRFADSVRAMSWHGPSAAHCATAYYAGAIRAYGERGGDAHRAAIDAWAERDNALFQIYFTLWREKPDSDSVVSAWESGYADGSYRAARAIQAD